MIIEESSGIYEGVLSAIVPFTGKLLNKILSVMIDLQVWISITPCIYVFSCILLFSSLSVFSLLYSIRLNHVELQDRETEPCVPGGGTTDYYTMPGMRSCQRVLCQILQNGSTDCVSGLGSCLYQGNDGEVRSEIRRREPHSSTCREWPLLGRVGDYGSSFSRSKATFPCLLTGDKKPASRISHGWHQVAPEALQGTSTGKGSHSERQLRERATQGHERKQGVLDKPFNIIFQLFQRFWKTHPLHNHKRRQYGQSYLFRGRRVGDRVQLSR
jgi:hypothetical protein